MISYLKLNTEKDIEEIVDRKEFLEEIGKWINDEQNQSSSLYILRADGSNRNLDNNSDTEKKLNEFFSNEDIKLSCSKWTAKAKYQNLFGINLLSVVEIIEKWYK